MMPNIDKLADVPEKVQHEQLSLDNSYVYSTKLVQIMSLGQKWLRPAGHMFYIDLFRENVKYIFLSENTRPRALMFGM